MILKTIKNNLLLFFILYRLNNSFLLKTVFEPDEIWQNLEPINYIFYNKGILTWDWMIGIRSVNYVLIYLIPLYFFKVFSDIFRIFCLFYLRNNCNILLFLNFVFFCFLLCFTIILCFSKITASGKFLIHDKQKLGKKILDRFEDDSNFKSIEETGILNKKKRNIEKIYYEKYSLSLIMKILNHPNILNNLYLIVSAILELKYRCFDERVIKYAILPLYGKYGYFVPKIVNGIIAGLADYLIIKLGNIYGADDRTLIYVTILSHGLWLYSPRSHINSFELFMAVLCLYTLEIFQTPTISLLSLCFTFYLRPSILFLSGVHLFFAIFQKKYSQIEDIEYRKNSLNHSKSNNNLEERLNCNETKNNCADHLKNRKPNENQIEFSKSHALIYNFKLTKVYYIWLNIISKFKITFKEVLYKLINNFCNKTDLKISNNLKKSVNETNIELNKYKKCFTFEKDNKQCINNSNLDFYNPEDKCGQYYEKNPFKDLEDQDGYRSGDKYNQSKDNENKNTNVIFEDLKIINSNDIEKSKDQNFYNQFGRRTLNNIKMFIKNIPYCLLLVLIMSLVDSYFYREWTFVPYVFFNVNIRWSVSEVFGEQHALSYVWFFIVLTGFTGTFLFLNFKANLKIAISVLIYLIFYSALKHKEMRFIVPVIPFCNLLCALGCSINANRNEGSINYLRKKLYSGFLYVGLYLTFFIGLYIGLKHQNTFDISFFMKTEVEKLLTERFFRENVNFKSYTYKNLGNEKKVNYNEKDIIETLLDSNNISSKDISNTFSMQNTKNIEILYFVCPYSLPVYSFICYENVTIKSVSRNPDITVKMKDFIVCKRFDGENIIFYEYEMYMDLLKTTSENYKTLLENKNDKNNEINVEEQKKNQSVEYENKWNDDKIVNKEVIKEKINNYDNDNDNDNDIKNGSYENPFENYDYILIYRHIFEKYSNVFYGYEIINTFKYMHLVFEEEKGIYMLVLKSKRFKNSL